MKSISRILMAMISLSLSVVCQAQIKNATTETVKIYGNCGMCETNIEKSGNQKKVATVDWNKDTKMATLTYDANKTTRDEILKRIALAGYDSDEFLAPSEAYANLAGCCQYERMNLTGAKMENTKMISLDPTPTMTSIEVPDIRSDMDMDVIPKNTDIPKNKSSDVEAELLPVIQTAAVAKHEHAEMVQEKDVTPKTPIKKVVTKQSNMNQFAVLFDTYFAVKNELVNSNGETVGVEAKILETAINAVKMESLTNEEMTVWMKVMKPLAADTKRMASTKNIVEQRKYFITLSANMYPLMKVAKTEPPVYYQFCPMANDGKGANWLSTDNVIQNPYYGSQMLSCGKTIETIQ